MAHARVLAHIAALSEGFNGKNSSLIDEISSIESSSINSKDPLGNTCLDLVLLAATRSRDPRSAAALGSLAAALISAGGEYSGDFFPVLLTVSKGSIASLRALTTTGLDVNERDWDGRTALHVAAADGKLDMVKVLVAAGADPSIPDRWGVTPAQEALRIGDARIAEAIRAPGDAGEVGLEAVVGMPELRLILLRELPLLASAGGWDMIEVLMSTPDGTACTYSEDLWYAHSDFLSRQVISYRRSVESAVLESSSPGTSVALEAYTCQEPMVLTPRGGRSLDALYQGQALADIGFRVAVIIPILYYDHSLALLQLFSTNPGKDSFTFDDATKLMDSTSQVIFSSLPRTLTGKMLAASQNYGGTGMLSAREASSGHREDLEEAEPENGVPREAPELFPVLNARPMARMRSLRLDASPSASPGTAFRRQRDQAIAEAQASTAAVTPESPLKLPTIPGARLSSAHLKHMTTVYQIIIREAVFNARHIFEEVLWYYTGLGMDPYYFDHFDPTSVARHVHAFMAAKEEAAVTGEAERIFLVNEGDSDAFYACPDEPEHVLATEKRIERAWLGMGYFTSQTQGKSNAPGPGAPSTPLASGEPKNMRFSGPSSASSGLRSSTSTMLRKPPPKQLRSPTLSSARSSGAPDGSNFAENGRSLRCFRTRGTASPDGNARLCLYFLASAPFVNPNPTEEEKSDIWEVATGEFLRDKTKRVRTIYEHVMQKAVKQLHPVFHLTEGDKKQQSRVVIAFKRGTTHSFFSSSTDLIAREGLVCNRKFVESFSNGIDVYSLYLEGCSKERIEAWLRKIDLFYVLPRTTLSPLFSNGVMSAECVSYAYAAWKFVFYFAARPGDDLAALSRALSHDPTNRSRLEQLGANLRRDVFTEQRVAETIFSNPTIVGMIYADFEQAHNAALGDQVLRRSTRATQEALFAIVRKQVADEVDAEVLLTMLLFNRAILKTNFFVQGKTALAFRIDVSFLGDKDRYAAYPDIPYGVFLMCGSTFRGFHVRFKDVARGGIRIIKSHDPNAFNRNKESLFGENYNLARTQMRKNKDIPEGGSKGTILISLGHSDKATDAFCMYVDALLSVSMLAPPSMVDYHGSREMLFLGPDEGTAGMMDWAALYARARGYEHWKAFTTGKSPTLGGIPHDTYGMTTRSVHQYVLGCLNKLGLDESQITKLQTGGPDGDLGSNEILISKDKTIAIVDGSGVLYDPEGIDREELRALAVSRRMVENFDRNRLSPSGFLITIHETDITVPGVGLVESGLHFRNAFHMHPLAAADCFVPCGGRPEAVNLRNVEQLLDEKTGLPRFRVIVEGANLFFSQEAREFLEERDVVLYKDASANKGGVTSSSLEVLAALSMNDAVFAEHMQVGPDGSAPAFYRRFVTEVQEIIEENARLEFECIWAEVERAEAADEPRRFRSELTDILSKRINALTNQIENSTLWDAPEIRSAVLHHALPKALLELIGFDAILARVPESYLRAIFGSFLASKFVYKRGLSATALDFYLFMSEFTGAGGATSGAVAQVAAAGLP